MSRKYQLTKISAGDYLLPNNEGTRLFRINQHVEVDGSGKVWNVHRYELPVSRMGDDLPDDFLEWHRWEYVAGGLYSRQDAIDTIAKPEPEIGQIFTAPDGSLKMRLW